MGVILCAPASVRLCAPHCPDRHLTCATLLKADTKGATPADAGEILAKELERLIHSSGFPAGLHAVGYSREGLEALVEPCFQQKRVVDNAPFSVTRDDIRAMYMGAFEYKL
eukprot:Colp12_sorted_trinity150504_noHs@7834